MGRFLFVVPPLVGHVNPTVSVARVLASRGHQVAWVAHGGTVRPLLPEDATVYSLDESVDAQVVSRVRERAASTRGAAALKFLWEDFFIPLARAMLPGVDAAVSKFHPDVMVVDQQAIAGALVARRRGLPWATFATTSAGVVDPLGSLPKVRRWLDDLLGALQTEAGLEAIANGTVSPSCIIAFTTRALIGDARALPTQTVLVGPALGGRPTSADFPWERLDPSARKVLVSVGTVNQAASIRFLDVAVEGIEALAGVQGVVAGVARDLRRGEGVAGGSAKSTIRWDYVPQLELMPHLAAVVCHGGHNTVVEALAHGLPLVVAPIRDDQPVVAEQVVAAGAGIRLRFGRAKRDDVRRALGRVLTEPSFRDAAMRIAASFDRAGGAMRAAVCLEEIL